jgi:hypothetical protein
MPRALKVFRTPIGFHDAYVAAPSQKAAMEAWGSGPDLFTRGEAELVTDPALTAEPLASPGVVIKRLRGTAEEQIAALRPSELPRKTKKAAAPKKKPVPPPKRAALDAAERALATASERQAAELKALAEREAELARERRALQKAQAEEIARLTRKRDEEEAAFEDAMGRWRRED